MFGVIHGAVWCAHRTEMTPKSRFSTVIVIYGSAAGRLFPLQTLRQVIRRRRFAANQTFAVWQVKMLELSPMNQHS